MKLLYTTSLILLIAPYTVIAQTANSPIVQIPYDTQSSTKGEMVTSVGVFANFISVNNKTSFILTHNTSPNEAEENEAIAQIKATKTVAKQTSAAIATDENGSRASNLWVGRNFSGNNGSGCPNDNTVAISSSGTIISGENSDYYYYSENGTLLGYTTMYNLFSGATNSSNLCDPKVVFDAGANRFILFAQVCDQVPSNSRLLMAFSLTSNPLDGFYTYWFDGNPRNDNSSFDYPKMAVFTDEVVVTGNLYTNSVFNQSLIYQINKNICYSGGAATFQYWYNISNSPFTIMPLGYGRDGTVGPPYNFVSTHAPGGGNTLDFYQLTGIASATNEALNHWTVNVQSYAVPGDAQQLNGSNYIDVGDCRIMDGFYLDGYAHFVHIYDQNGWSGVRYNRLNISNLTNEVYDIQYSGTKDYSYPSICSFGTINTDLSVLIHFLSSGPSIYPEMRAKEIDNAMQSNSSILVKGGISAVTSCFDQGRNASRWGDYSGVWRKPYSNPPVAWASGSYGDFGAWATWVAEINGTVTGIEDVSKANSISVSPNPTLGSFVISINTPETANYTMKIFTTDGKETDSIELGIVPEGGNKLTYLKKLPAGMYIISVFDKNNKQIANEKVLVSG